MRTLMPIRTGGAKPPLFCIHGEPLKMAQEMHPERPLYGIYCAYDPDFESVKDIEELAAVYLREARLIQPHGPYYLVGFCAGGLAAFEMARQLLEAGEQVAYLGLLDPTVPGRRPSRREWISNALSVPGQRLAAAAFLVNRARLSLLSRARTAFFHMAAFLYDISGGESPLLVRQVQLNGKLRRAFANYRYSPLPMVGYVFSAELDSEAEAQMRSEWNAVFTSGASIIPIPGLAKHTDFMAEPFHSRICQLISRHLETSTAP